MILAGVPLALITLAAGTAVAFPAARHIASALWNLPDRRAGCSASNAVE
jgi:hypothetical protein